MKSKYRLRDVTATILMGSGLVLAAGLLPSTGHAATAPADSLAVGLLAHWPLDDGLANPSTTLVKDQAGTSPGTLTAPDPATAWLPAAEARIGGALRVAGETTFVSFPSGTALNPPGNQVSVALWVKLDTAPSDLAEGFAGLFDSAQDAYALYLDRAAAELRFKTTDAAGQAARPGISQEFIAAGEWQHVAAVYDGQATPTAGEARIYLNGELVDTHVGADGAGGAGLTGVVRADQVSALGRDGGEARYFLDAALDDVAVWRRALSAEEIRYLANGNAVPAPRPPDDALAITKPPQGVTALDGSYVSFQVTLSNAVPPVTYQWRRNGADLAGSTLATLAVVASGSTSGSYTVLVKDSRGSLESGPALLTVTPLASQPAQSLRQGLIAQWPFDDALRTPGTPSIVDVVHGNVGQLTSPAPEAAWLAGTEARFGGALRFDGAETFVSVAPTDSLNVATDQITIATWVKLSALPSELPEGFGGIYDSVQDNCVLYLDRGNKELRFKITDAKGQAARPGIPEANLVLGEWLHVAGVYNGRATPGGGEATLYLNGVLADTHVGNDGSGGAGLNGLVRPGQVAAIGRNGAENRYFLDAVIDDLALWHRALSPAEIAHLAAGNAVPLPVADAPVQLAAPVVRGGDLVLAWSGGQPPYRVQRRATLVAGTWENVGALTDATTATVPLAGANAGFYRVAGTAAATP